LAVEALHNAARHAGARHVRLGIEQAGRNGQIRLWVEDDGCGIEPSTLAEPGGMGLLAMRRRAEAIGGDLSIDSNPGRFTRIELTFDGLGRYGHRPSWRNWWQRNRRRAMNDGANA
jgi:signal transduction histidine kinase